MLISKEKIMETTIQENVVPECTTTRLIQKRSTHPLNYGIELWIDEGGRLLLSDPSRFDAPTSNQQAAQSFILPIGKGGILFEHRLTACFKRVFEATSILTEVELAHCQAPLWSSVLGRYQEVPEWLALMWFFVQAANCSVPNVAAIKT